MIAQLNDYTLKKLNLFNNIDALIKTLKNCITMYQNHVI